MSGVAGASAGRDEVVPEGMAPTDRVRLNTWVKRAIFDGVSDIAKSEDTSVSDVVREALKEYIRRYKSRAKGVGR